MYISTNSMEETLWSNYQGYYIDVVQDQLVPK